jgi:hypothetical protein
MSESKVRVSLTDGTFEFEGSESFVAAQVEKFAAMIQAAVAVQWPDAAGLRADPPAEAPPVAIETPPEPVIPPAPVTVAPPPEVEFADMYAPTVDGVQILKRVPGGSWAQKTVNGAKLYLYGLQLLKKREMASFGEIKKVCRAQGCYDSHNMAAYLKADQQAFVFAGNGKRQTVKLSAPGLNAAAQLLANVRAGNDAMYRRKKRIAS